MSAIKNFKDFLKIKSISAEGPKGSYWEAVNFLEKKFIEIFPNLKKGNYSNNIRNGKPGCKVIEMVKNKPILLITIPGKNPKLKSILLNSHYDVVPAVYDKWDKDPFSAYEDSEGNIYARGAQDMKCVCMMYLEAIRNLVKRNKSYKIGSRTIHLTYVPDEEIGGNDGLLLFSKTKFFKTLNVGFSLDEGLANPKNKYTCFYGERAMWWVKIRANGSVGHGSRLIENPAAQKLIRAINHFLKYRSEQEKKYKHGCKHAEAIKLGDVVTINLTGLKANIGSNGKFVYNVVPHEAEAGFDIRIPPHVKLDDFENLIKKWTSKEDVSYEFAWKTPTHAVTSIDPKENQYWDTFVESIGFKNLDVEIFPAATDGRHLRVLGYPVIGFSPIKNTKILLHDHNEMLNKKVFLDGIKIYEKLIFNLSNTPKNNKLSKL